MSRYSAPVSVDPESRMKKIFHRLEDGDWAYETIQDVEPILDANKWNQSHNRMTGGIRRTASVPHVVWMEWEKRYGFSYFSSDPAVQGFIDRLLDSAEWKWLRTDDTVLSKHKVSKREVERRHAQRQQWAEL